MIGIIGAMDTEIKNLVSNLKDTQITEYGGLKYYKGILNGKDVVVVKSGVGKVNAALCAQYLAIHFNVEKIINTGIAGAAGKGLGVFDFVVSDEAVYHDVDISIFGYEKGQLPGLPKTFVADLELADKAVTAFRKSVYASDHKIVKGIVASGDQFIAEKAVKDRIIENFKPMCVEMEGAAIAHACALNNVPFVIIRCLSDCADDSAGNTYEFNEDVCAAACSNLIMEMLGE